MNGRDVEKGHRQSQQKRVNMPISDGSEIRTSFQDGCDVNHEKEGAVTFCQSRSPTPRTCSVTVIMPVRNESRHIRETLEGLLAQDYPHDALEVLVIDGDSTDGTSMIVREFAARDPRVKLLYNPSRLSSAARNIGVRSARGDVLVVIDGHCQFPDTRYIYNLAEAFHKSQADCLGRPQSLDVAGGSSLQAAIAAARASRLGHNPGSYIYSDKELFVPAHSVGVAYRREVFEQIGEFDESFDACEDVEFNHRLDNAGLRCLLAPSIALRYHPRCTLKGLFRQLARYGTGRVRLARKHPDTFSPLTFAPAAFLAFLLIGAPLSVVWPFFAAVYLTTSAAYLAVVLGFSLAVAVHCRRPGMLAYLPAVFSSIHFGAGYGELREACVGLFAASHRDVEDGSVSISSQDVSESPAEVA